MSDTSASDSSGPDASASGTDPTLEASIVIAAPPERVWETIADIRRMSEWSPQVESTRLRSGYDTVALGSQFSNRNVQGDFAWITRGEIVRYDPPTAFAFRILENDAIWSLTLEPESDGTRLTQRRESPDGLTELSHAMIETYMGGAETFTAEMRAGMNETLERIRATVEGEG